MILLALLGFFCLTGIFLNHPDWFDDSYEEASVTFLLPHEIKFHIQKAQSLASIPVKELQQYIASTYHLNNINEISFDAEMKETTLDYQLPAGYATVYISSDGLATMDYRKGSWITIANDLHKGRHSGIFWQWVIDISAFLIVLFSLAGFVILIQNKKHRVAGLIAGLFGIVIPIAIYWAWVPTIQGV